MNWGTPSTATFDAPSARGGNNKAGIQSRIRDDDALPAMPSWCTREPGYISNAEIEGITRMKGREFGPVRIWYEESIMTDYV